MAFRPPLDFFAALAVGVPGGVPAVPPGTVVAQVGGPVDAVGTHLAYSRPEGDGFRLVVDGIDAPVAVGSEPFDVDLGTDAGGRLTAVWSSGGAIRALDVGSGRQRAVPGARGFAPSVSRGRLLFATDGAERDGLALTSLAGGRIQPLPMPSQTRGGCTPESCGTFAVRGAELAGGVLAFTAAEEGIPEFNSGQLWSARIGRTPRLLLRRGGSVNQRTDLFAPSVSSKWVTAGLNHVGDGGGGPDTYSRLVRASPARGVVEQAAVADVSDRANARPERPQRDLRGLGTARRATYVSACSTTLVEEVDGTTDCRLTVSPKPRWRRLAQVDTGL